MAKDSTTGAPGTPKASPAAPMFAFARTVLDEMDKQSERAIEFSAGQAGEVTAVLRTIRAQVSGLQRTMLDTIEHLTADAAEAAQQWQKTFGRGIA
jgi:hypothetical protein